MNNLKEPKHFKTFRIVAFSLLFVGIILIILGCVVFRQEWGFDNDTIPNFGLMVPGIFLCFFSFPCFFLGFMPKINKMSIDSAKYMQESNKENLTDIANTTADIVDESITKVVSSVKKGMKETKFCKHCGAKIDKDSKFCKDCGKEQ